MVEFRWAYNESGRVKPMRIQPDGQTYIIWHAHREKVKLEVDAPSSGLVRYMSCIFTQATSLAFSGWVGGQPRKTL